jgi:hypothetical protein
MANEEQLGPMSADEFKEQSDRERRDDAESARRQAIYTALKNDGLTQYTFNVKDIGEGPCLLRVYMPAPHLPACSKFADFNSRHFGGHYAGYGTMLETAKLICDVLENPNLYTCKQLRSTAIAALEHVRYAFCSRDWEGSEGVAEALRAMRDTVYGSSFAPTNQPGKFFCLLHGSDSHATGGCDKLKKLRDRWGLERWNPSEEPKLC